VNERFRLRVLSRARLDPELARRLRELAQWDRLLSTAQPHLQQALAQSPGHIRSLLTALQVGCRAIAWQLREADEDPQALASELERNLRAWVGELGA
jgi:hypothetical protein